MSRRRNNYLAQQRAKSIREQSRVARTKAARRSLAAEYVIYFMMGALMALACWVVLQ